MCSLLGRVLTQIATAKTGIVLVNINPAYRPNELLFAMKKVVWPVFDQGQSHTRKHVTRAP